MSRQRAVDLAAQRTDAKARKQALAQSLEEAHAAAHAEQVRQSELQSKLERMAATLHGTQSAHDAAQGDVIAAQHGARSVEARGKEVEGRGQAQAALMDQLLAELRRLDEALNVQQHQLRVEQETEVRTRHEVEAALRDIKGEEEAHAALSLAWQNAQAEQHQRDAALHAMQAQLQEEGEREVALENELARCLRDAAKQRQINAGLEDVLRTICTERDQLVAKVKAVKEAAAEAEAAGEDVQLRMRQDEGDLEAARVDGRKLKEQLAQLERARQQLTQAVEVGAHRDMGMQFICYKNMHLICGGFQVWCVYLGEFLSPSYTLSNQ